MESANRPVEEQVFKFKTIGFKLLTLKQYEIVTKQTRETNFGRQIQLSFS